MISLPSAPGTYALQLHLAGSLEQEIGRLGKYHFPAGELIYIGSAFGPGGLRARLGRHLNRVGVRRWHIDNLLPSAQVVGFWMTTLPFHLECHWVSILLTLPGVVVPAAGLGASDCRNDCPAHLLAFSEFDEQSVNARLAQIVDEAASQARICDCQVIRTICQPIP